MSLTIGELVGYLKLEDSQWKRGNRQARDDLRDLGNDIDGFGNRSAAAFLRAANSLSNIPTAAAGIHGVVSILGSLSGVLGLIPAAAAAAAAGVAAIKVGTAGFGKALSTALSGGGGGGGGGGSSAADAAVQSARRIQSAEESLSRAQQTARDAQAALTRARKEAAEQLEDLRIALAGAALDEEAAQVALERAQERLAQAKKDGAKGLDLREAELGVRQAAQALDEVKERYADLREESRHASQVGVEGSDLVVAAQRRVADTSQAVEDAQRQLAYAHEDAAKGATKSAGGHDALAEALAKLSPNARATVLAVLALKGQWTDMQHAVQDQLFAGFATQVKQLGSTYIPILKTGLGGIAGEMNHAALQTAGFLSQGQQVATINQIFAGTKQVTGELGGALQPLVSILLDLVTVGMEFLPGLSSGFGGAAQHAAEFVHQARESGQLHQWIAKGLATVGDLVQLFKNLGSIVATVFTGLNSGGGGLLNTLLKVTDTVKTFLKSFEGQQALHAVGDALNTVSTVITQVLLEAFKQLAPVIIELAPGFAELARQVGDMLVSALQIAGPLLKGLAEFLSDNIDWLGPLAIAIFGAIKAFEALMVTLRILNALTAVNPWVFLIAATIALAILIITHWDQIKAALAAAWDWIKNTARTAWEHIKSAIIDPITGAARWVGDRVSDMVGWFASLPRRIGDALGTLGDIIGGVFKGALNGVIGFLNWWVDRINWIVHGINDISGIVGVPAIPDIPHIPKLHTGGIVPGPAGSERLYLLKAGEEVLTAEQRRRRGGVPDDAFWGAQNRAAVQIENFYATPNQTPDEIAFELDWASRGGGR